MANETKRRRLYNADQWTQFLLYYKKKGKRQCVATCKLWTVLTFDDCLLLSREHFVDSSISWFWSSSAWVFHTSTFDCSSSTFLSILAFSFFRTTSMRFWMMLCSSWKAKSTHLILVREQQIRLCARKSSCVIAWGVPWSPGKGYPPDQSGGRGRYPVLGVPPPPPCEQTRHLWKQPPVAQKNAGGKNRSNNNHDDITISSCVTYAYNHKRFLHKRQICFFVIKYENEMTHSGMTFERIRICMTQL